MSLTAESLVVDASVAVKWFLTDEVLSEQALAVWQLQTEQSGVLTAPVHIYVEVANAILAATRYNPPRLTLDDGRALIGNVLRVRIRTVPARELIIPAYEIASQYRLSLYDALYLALCQQYAIPLVTADANFHRKVHNEHDVLWLGEVEA